MHYENYWNITDKRGETSISRVIGKIEAEMEARSGS